MIARHGIVYFTSRIVAAAGNLAAIAIFTHMAGPTEYGRYTTAMAIAVIASSFAIQWCRYAYFEVYRPATGEDLLKTYSVIVSACIALAMAALCMLAPLFGWSTDVTVAAVLLTLGLSLFDATLETYRTRLDAAAVARRWIARTGLILAFGSVALATTGSALVLAYAVTAAYLVVVLPGLVRDLRRGGAVSGMQARNLTTFGGPLVLSFGIASLAQNLDRLLLAHFSGLAAVAAYVALSDLVRANMVLLAEVVNISIVSVAKRQHDANETAMARRNLDIAYRLFLLLGCFGGLGILLFGPPVIDILLPASFRLDLDAMLPIITVSTVLLLVRNHYFGQVIYFSGRSRLDMYASAVLLVSNAALCGALVPPFGALGAASAFLGGQVVTLVFYIALGRSAYALPTPMKPTLAVCGIALGLICLKAVLTVFDVPPMLRYAVEAFAYFGCLYAVLTTWLDRDAKGKIRAVIAQATVTAMALFHRHGLLPRWWST